MSSKKKIIKEYKKRHVKKINGVISGVVSVLLSIFLIAGILILITNTVNNHIFNNLDELIETAYEVVEDDLTSDIDRDQLYTELISFIDFFDVNCNNVNEKISFYSDEELIKRFVLISESCFQDEIDFELLIDKYYDFNMDASKSDFEEAITVLLNDFQSLDKNLAEVFPDSPNLVNLLSFVFSIASINMIYFFLIAIFLFLFFFVIINDWLITLYYIGKKLVMLSLLFIISFLVPATNVLGFSISAFSSHLNLDLSVLIELSNVINSFMIKSTVIFLVFGLLFLVVGIFLKRYSFKKMVYVLANEIRIERKEE